MQKIHLLLIGLLSASFIYAQEYVEMMQNKSANFHQIQKAFNDYWQNKPYEKGKGWKQFKRWEYLMESRVDENGNFPDPGMVWTEHLKFQQKYQSNASAKSNNKSSNWTSLGPDNWNSIGWNPGIGRINVIAVDPNNASILYVGAPAGGCWKSTNGGNSWTPLTDTLATLGVSGIAINPQNSNEIYLATGDGDGSDTYSIGVIKSTDGGNTWQSTGLNWNTTQSRVMSKIIINPNNPAELYVATNNGLWKTSNSGSSWINVRNGVFRDVEYNPLNTNTVYACTNTNFFKSINGGAFNMATVGLPNVTQVGRMTIAVTANDTNYIYLLAANSSDYGFLGLYRSTDGGNTFSLRTNSPNILGWNTTGSDSGGQGWYDLALAVSPFNKNEVFTGGVNVWKSTNGGASFSANTQWNWPTGSFGYVHADIHTLDYFGNNLFCGSDGGIFKSTNSGGSWTDLTAGLEVTQFYRLGMSATNAGTVIGGAQDNGCSLLKSGSWTHVTGGDGMECLVDYSNDNYIYSTSQYGTIYRSTNGGGSFSNISGSINESGAWVTPYVIDPNNPSTLYAGYTNVFKTTNRGNSWSQISNFSATGTIRSMAVAPSNSNVIYIATLTQIRKTTNGGGTWTVITNGLPNLNISYIAVHNLNPNILWVTFSGFSAGNKIFKSTDGGTSWVNVSGNLPNIPVNCIVYENGTNNGIYVGTDMGVYYKNDDLLNWEAFMDNLPNVQVNELEIFYPTGKIRAATYGRGIWETGLFLTNTPPVAQFSTPDTLICPNICVQFTNQTINLGQQWTWHFPGGTPTTSTDLNPTVCYPSTGNYDVSLVVSNANGTDSLHKSAYVLVQTPSNGMSLPVAEGFENGTASPNGWKIINPDNGETWKHNNTLGAYGTSSSCLFIENRNYTSFGEKDELISPLLDFSGLTAAYLSFDKAHAYFNNNLFDTLSIYYSIDCGVTKNLLWREHGVDLSTLPSLYPPYFIPTASQWENVVVDLTPIIGMTGVSLIFENSTGNSNNLYLDNINIIDSTLVGIDESVMRGISLFPNPAQSSFTVTGLSSSSSTILVKDLSGKTVKSIVINSTTALLDVDNLPNGFYFIEITNGKKQQTLKLVKQQ